jgi:hypothetical protein
MEMEFEGRRETLVFESSLKMLKEKAEEGC